jgi:hypothetical protein
MSMRKFYLVTIVFFTIYGFAAAQSASVQTNGVAVGIKFYDKQMYYPQSGPIYIQVSVTNNSPQPYHFRLSDDRIFSLDFDTRTLNNRAVEASDVLQRRRSGNTQVFFREIVLESGETFSFTENLRDYAKLDASGSFIVQAKLYPDLYRGEGVAAQSNRLSLQIRPAIITDETGLPIALAEAAKVVLSRERLAPDDVISWTLHARQRSQWEKFFLYLDIEQMLARDAGRQRQWRAESEEGRLRMIARYRHDLQNALIDGDIVSIPSEFKIERTVYNEDEGTVTVLERFNAGDFIEKKRFTYYLRRHDGIWTIYDYVVMNLGTE